MLAGRTHGDVGRGGIVVLLGGALLVAAHAVVAGGQHHGDAARRHLLQLVVEALVGGVVVVAAVLAVADAVHQGRGRLVAHDVGVVQHLVLDAHARLRDLVGGRVHEAAHRHDVLHVQVGLHGAADVAVVVAVHHAAGLAHLVLVELLEEGLQVGGVEVGQRAVLDHGLAAQHGTVGAAGGSLLVVIVRRRTGNNRLKDRLQKASEMGVLTP